MMTNSICDITAVENCLC